MGEEGKQEPPKAEEKPAEEKKEEKQEEKPKEEKQDSKPPSPCVLFVDLHCMGCAKKIEKYILKMKGVEGVVIDMSKNEVTIKGIVEPQGICNIITKKTKRRANVISPLPAAEGEPVSEVVTSQVSAPVVVELNVNMHCEACAEQLKRKILQMRGVQTAVAEFSTGKVTVTGTMDSNKLVDYVYRRTRKQAKIVPQPEPEPEKKHEESEKPAEAAEPDQEKKEGEKLAEEPKKEEEKPAEEPKKEEEKPAEEPNKEEEKPADEPKKEEGGEQKNDNKEEKGGEEEAKKEVADQNNDEEGMKRMMYYYQPLYVIERIPPPQLFSDENPNACCIS